MKKALLVVFTILYLVIFTVVSSNASGLQGCCSHHDGVVVVDGKVMCGDGTLLSDICQNKLDKYRFKITSENESSEDIENEEEI